MWGFKEKQIAEKLKKIAQKSSSKPTNPFREKRPAREFAVLLLVTDDITAATVDSATGKIILGSGLADYYLPFLETDNSLSDDTLISPTNIGELEELKTGLTVLNSTLEVIKAGEIIKGIKIAGKWHVISNSVERYHLVEGTVDEDFGLYNDTFSITVTRNISGKSKEIGSTVQVNNEAIATSTSNTPFQLPNQRMSRNVGDTLTIIHIKETSEEEDEWAILQISEWVRGTLTKDCHYQDVATGTLGSPYNNTYQEFTDVSVAFSNNYFGNRYFSEQFQHIRDRNYDVINATGRYLFAGATVEIDWFARKIINSDSPDFLVAIAQADTPYVPTEFHSWTGIDYKDHALVIDDTFTIADLYDMLTYVRSGDAVAFSLVENGTGVYLVPIQMGKPSRWYENDRWALTKPDATEYEQPDKVFGRFGGELKWADPTTSNNGGDPVYYYAGCGLDLNSYTFSVDPHDIAGGGLIASSTGCSISVNYGCGLKEEGGVILVDPDALTGQGLVSTGSLGACDISVSLGCGLRFDGTDAIEINPADLAGDGLEVGVGSCELAVKVGCGMEINLEGAIAVNPYELAGDGLIVDGAEDCAIKINVGCGLTIAADIVKVNASDLVGQGLTTGPGCSIDVDYGCGLKIVANALVVDSSDLAGAGLTTSGVCAVDVNPGCGIEIVADKVRVKNSDLAGDGLEVGTGECSIDVNYGCGLITIAGVLQVNPNDLAGAGLAPTVGTGICSLRVEIDCGLTFAGNAIAVNNADLAGTGLTTEGTCGLALNLGCGLTFNGDAVEVDPADLAGAGLITGFGCQLAVNPGCGIQITGDAVAIYPDDIAGLGLIVGGSTGCAIDVNVGCGLTIIADAVTVNASDLAGDYLSAGSGCSLNVDSAQVNFVEDIDAVDVDVSGGYLTVTIYYTRTEGAYVLADGTQTPYTVEGDTTTTPCPY